MVALGEAPQIYAASIGIQDSVFLMLLALVVFGPRRLPEIGRQIGKLMYEFRKVSNDFKFQMEEELRTHEEAERQKKLQASLPAPAAVPETPVDATPMIAAPVAAEVATETLSTEPVVEAQGAGEPQAMPQTPITPQILPPSTGEQVAAARPFRSSPAPDPTPEPVEHPAPVSEPFNQPESIIQPGVSAETETHHG